MVRRSMCLQASEMSQSSSSAAVRSRTARELRVSARWARTLPPPCRHGAGTQILLPACPGRTDTAGEPGKEGLRASFFPAWGVFFMRHGGTPQCNRTVGPPLCPWLSQKVLQTQKRQPAEGTDSTFTLSSWFLAGTSDQGGLCLDSGGTGPGVVSLTPYGFIVGGESPTICALTSADPSLSDGPRLPIRAAPTPARASGREASLCEHFSVCFLV